MAAAALLEKKVKRIVLARPAVEAGERLGFLPGDLVEKVNPYLRPLYDALYDILGYEKTAKLLERGIIEVAPIAFMRGRTLNDAFIILDEAQNTTSEQMKMFLTRIGFGSKAVVTGDITQIDLPQGKTSGLREAQQLLSRIEGIRFVLFDERDVVRHPLVQSIITAYESARPGARGGRPRARAAERPLRVSMPTERLSGARRPLFGGAPLRPRRRGHAAERRVRPLLWAAAYVLVTTLAFSPTLSFRDAPGRSRASIATRDVVAPRDLIVADPDGDRAPARGGRGRGPRRLRLGRRGAGPLRGASCGRSFEKARAACPRSRPRARDAAVRDAFDLPIGDEALAALARLGFSQDDRGPVRRRSGSTSTAAGSWTPRPVCSRPAARGHRAPRPLTGREASGARLADVVEYGTETKAAVGERGCPSSALSARERAEVAAFLAAALRPNLTYDAALTAERRAAAARSVESVLTRIPRGKVIVRTRRRDHAARGPVDRGRARLGLGPVVLGQGHRDPDPADPGARRAFWLDARRQRRRRRERTPGVVYGSVLATGILFALVTRGRLRARAGALAEPRGRVGRACNYAIPFAAGPIVVEPRGRAWVRRCSSRWSTRSAPGVLMGLRFPFALFALVGSLAGIYGLGKLRARSVLLAMGGIVAAGNLVADRRRSTS